MLNVSAQRSRAQNHKIVIDDLRDRGLTRAVSKKLRTLEYCSSYRSYLITYLFSQYRHITGTVNYSLGEYEKRVNELIEIGEEEGIHLNERSLADFVSFLRTINDLKGCGLTLTDAGNLSVLWVEKSIYRVSVRFFGDDTVQFTFITFESPEQPVVDSGECSVREFVTRVQNFGLLCE